MHWKRKSKLNLNGVYSKHSLSKKLKEEGKSSDEFEFYIGRLSLEELIALKLEVSARMLGGKLYGFNIWSAMPKIAKDAALMFAISSSNTIEEAATILNMNTLRYLSILDIYKTDKYFGIVKRNLTTKQE
jgi:hypothetical protein